MVILTQHVSVISETFQFNGSAGSVFEYNTTGAILEVGTMDPLSRLKLEAFLRIGCSGAFALYTRDSCRPL